MARAIHRLALGDRVIPEEALQWSFGPSGGPGGQHANRSNTRATLRLDLNKVGLSADALEDLQAGLGPRAAGGVIEVQVDESRSQWRNRQTALRRMQVLLDDALRRAAPRVPTKPTRASKRRRRRQKDKQSEKKRLRRRPPAD